MPPFRVVLECRWIFSLGIFGSLLFCFGDDWIGVPVISKGSVGWYGCMAWRPFYLKKLVVTVGAVWLYQQDKLLTVHDDQSK